MGKKRESHAGAILGICLILLCLMLLASLVYQKAKIHQMEQAAVYEAYRAFASSTDPIPTQQ